MKPMARKPRSVFLTALVWLGIGLLLFAVLFITFVFPYLCKATLVGGR